MSARSLAFEALGQIWHQGAYTDVALDRVLRQANRDLAAPDRRLATELVYGCVRRQRTLDSLIEQLSQRTIAQQPPKLRLVLHIGLYQLRYLDHVPPSAAVNTSVELAKQAGLPKLSGVVNGILRQYLRLAAQVGDPLQLPPEPIARLGVAYSFPDWLIRQWLQQFGESETVALCTWFNQPATIDLRVNALKTTRSQVQAALSAVGVLTQPVAAAPHALRLMGAAGAIPHLPGFNEGHWMVQESSAQLVSLLLDPQPGETVIDACAAPGGKATHLAELMHNQGRILACDRVAHRLKKITANAQRLGLSIIETYPVDSCVPQDWPSSDRVLLDVPCSGLGTLHRHPDIRWRQHPDAIATLVALQRQLLAQGSTGVKPGGRLVYATCTLNPDENEGVIQDFLRDHPDWCIAPLPANSPLQRFQTPAGWFYILPHQHHMDGFFMVALVCPLPA